MYTTYHQAYLCPGYGLGAGDSALTQQSVHGYRGSTVTVHNILSGKAVSGYAPGAIRVNQCMTEIARMCTDKSITLHEA